jgi:biopolymer transport protein ExbD
MSQASFKESSMRSPLKEAMRVDPSSRGSKRTKKVVATLILTSLVDAFSIMLLYLLVQNTGNGSTVELMNSEKLPSAIKTEALHDGTLVRFDGRNYFLGEQMISQEELAQRLAERRQQLDKDQDALIIQADRSVDFAMLTPVIRAGSVSGFNKFKFAVLQGEQDL